MHELSLASAVLDIALRTAKGRRVTKVTVEAGRLRQVAPEAMTFSFEMVAQGTEAEGAVLEIVPVAARGECRKCGAVSELTDFPLLCRECGSFDLNIVAGEELLVASLEVEDGHGAEIDDDCDGRNPGCQ